MAQRYYKLAILRTFILYYSVLLQDLVYYSGITLVALPRYCLCPAPLPTTPAVCALHLWLLSLPCVLPSAYYLCRFFPAPLPTILALQLCPALCLLSLPVPCPSALPLTDCYNTITLYPLRLPVSLRVLQIHTGPLLHSRLYSLPYSLLYSVPPSCTPSCTPSFTPSCILPHDIVVRLPLRY